MQISIADSVEFNVLCVIHLLRDADYLDSVHRILKPDHFNRPDELAFKVLTMGALEYYNEYHKPPEKLSLQATLAKILHANPGVLPDHELSVLADLVETAYNYTAPLQTIFMEKQTENFLRTRELTDILRSNQTIGPEYLEELANKLVETTSRTKIRTGKEEDIWTDKDCGSAKRVPTNVRFFDTLLGGGTLAGEVVGLLGKSGGGKTTLGVQILCSAAAGKRHVGYLSYETDVKPELSNRIYSFIGKVPRSRLENRKWMELNESDRKAIEKAENDYAREFIHVVNMKMGGNDAGSGGADEVGTILRDFERKGTPLDLVIIDQYLPMVDRYIARYGGKMTDRRQVMQSMTSRFMEIAQPSQHNTCIILLHQLAPDAGMRSPTSLTDFTHAAECRSFAFWLSNCMAIGNLDGDGIGLINCSKARNTSKSDEIIQLKGEDNMWMWHERNEHGEGNVTLGDGKFIVKGKDSRNSEDLIGTKTRKSGGLKSYAQPM